MTRNRAFTVVEMMIVVGLTALIVGAVSAIYTFTISRLGYSFADASTQREAEYGLDIIEQTIAKAQSCTQVSVGNNACLKCTMPANCVDTNGDGILDACTPNAINRRSQERWGQGNRVWFYLSDATGLPANIGSVLWMAKRPDDVTPIADNQVKIVTYFPGNSKLRLDLLQLVTTSSATYSNAYSAVVSVGAYGGQGQQAASSLADSNSSYQLTMSRVPYMHGWRF